MVVERGRESPQTRSGMAAGGFWETGRGPLVTLIPSLSHIPNPGLVQKWPFSSPSEGPWEPRERRAE